MQQIKSTPLSFTDIESRCRANYNQITQKFGGIWHVCTPGHLQQILNTSEDDFKFSVSNSAISAAECGCTVITDAIMENHIHVLMACTMNKCFEFLNSFRCRLDRYYKGQGRSVELSEFQCGEPIEVENLEAARNEIAYINRNGYVGNTNWLPYSYPWGGGSLYFNQYAKNVIGEKYNSVSFIERRRLCKKRVTSMPERYMVKDGMILPASYIRCELGESLFRNAHHYFQMLTKNVEAYSLEAQRLGDTVVLSREEMYSAVKALCTKEFGIDQPALLDSKTKLEMARRMHSKLKATNSQIQMILRLPIEDVNAMFPLSVKK